MNRGGGGFQSFLVQQMIMGGNPSSWWPAGSTVRAATTATAATAALSDHEEEAAAAAAASPLDLPSSSPSPLSSVFPHLLPTNNHDLPESWIQLLLQGGLGGGGGGGGGGEEEEYSCRYGSNPYQGKDVREMEMYRAGSEHTGSSTGVIRQEMSSSDQNGCYAYSRPQWSQLLQASSPRSCVTTASTASFNSNMLDFSNSKAPGLGQGHHHHHHHHQPENYSSETCNSTTSGSAFKKARVQGSSPVQSTFKVRKEKLGDRITALHQIVSPFGKTDTASVLLEAIGYIRFLLSQVEALSSPYLATASGNTRHPGQGESNCIFPEDPGQLLQDNTTKKRVSPGEGFDNETKNKDLRARGLCLVPVSCTLHVGGGTTADFWAPNAALGGGGGGF